MSRLRRIAPYVLIVAVMMPAAGAVTGVSASAPQRYVLLGTGNVLPAGLEELIAAVGGRVVARMDAIGVAVAESASPAFPAAVLGIAGIQGVHPDLPVLIAPPVAEGAGLGGIWPEGFSGEGLDPVDATFFWAQWNMRAIRADRAWEAGFRGDRRVKVAIIDTGVDYTHQELQGSVDLALSRSFFPETMPAGVLPIADLHGHGTHIAGIVAGAGFRTTGVAPGVTIVAIKVAGRSGFAGWSAIIQGIVHAAEIRADVVNMSFGEAIPEEILDATALRDALERAIEYAADRGALLVASAGNTATNWDARDGVLKLPAHVEPVAGVSATGPTFGQHPDALTPYSDYGTSIVSLAAPGGNRFPGSMDDYVAPDGVLSACTSFMVIATPNGPFAPCASKQASLVAWGTSMAAAHVTAVAALVDSVAGGALTGGQLLAILTRSADDLGAPGHDALYGHGRVNAWRAVMLAAGR